MESGTGTTRHFAAEGMPAALTVREAARELGVHPNTLRRLIADRHLRALRLGPRGNLRIRARDLDDFIARARAAAVEDGDAAA